MIDKSRNFLFLIMFMVGMLCFASWQVQQKIENGLREDIGASIQTVLKTTHQAIQTWVKEQRASAFVWANTQEVRQMTRALLAMPHKRKVLQSAPAQAELRKFLQPVKITKKYQGYFIISKEGISLASSRDENIGTQNLLVSQQTFLQNILSGKSAISLPQSSDVPLLNRVGQYEDKHPTMFVGAPILDENHNVIAIFVFRVDPDEDFTKIFQRGQIGNTGETYAFNRMGQMASNSRFESLLRSLGLLQADQHSMLHIQIRDPGVNLLTRPNSYDAQSELPLTLMAKQALAGTSGRNLEGYRDYRGVPVIGTWLWDQDLNLGITTEVDVDEAYATLSSVHYAIYTLTALSILLLFGLWVYFLYNRKRTLEGEIQFRKIVDESPYPIAITDKDGNIEHFNKKFIELFGWTRNDARTPDEWWRIAYPDEDYRKKVMTEWESAREKALRSGTEIEPQQWKLTCKNGDVREVEFRMVPVNKEYNVIAMQDLTERLKAEQEKEHLQRQLMQAQKMEAIGQMTGGIAHDFNNILASIQGFTELAKETALSDDREKLSEYLDEVLQSNERASNLVAKMLAYSRGNHHELMRQSLQNILNNALSMLKSIIPSSIIFNTEIEEPLPDILADAVQLQQVIINLCTNARDAMQGKGRIDIHLRKCRLTSEVCLSCHQSFEGEYVELSVTDYGGGIQTGVTNRIFDPFFTTKEVGKGSGMGLAMVHGIVHDHNGHIIVDNKPGASTRFSIYFPVTATNQVDSPTHIAETV